jgi:glycogen phosphorylase
VEIRQEVGEENFFLFGHTTEELVNMRASYSPCEYYEGNSELKKVIDQISGGYFSPGSPDQFRPVIDPLLQRDSYFVLADYASYMECQDEVSLTYKDRDLWTKKAILNVARCGKFSSDRAVKEYADRIWGVTPVLI